MADPNIPESSEESKARHTPERIFRTKTGGIHTREDWADDDTDVYLHADMVEQQKNELLVALKEAEKWIAPKIGSAYVLSAIRAAIAKAEGTDVGG